MIKIFGEQSREESQEEPSRLIIPESFNTRDQEDVSRSGAVRSVNERRDVREKIKEGEVPTSAELSKLTQNERQPKRPYQEGPVIIGGDNKDNESVVQEVEDVAEAKPDNPQKIIIPQSYGSSRSVRKEQDKDIEAEKREEERRKEEEAKGPKIARVKREYQEGPVIIDVQGKKELEQKIKDREALETTREDLIKKFNELTGKTLEKDITEIVKERESKDEYLIEKYNKLTGKDLNQEAKAKVIEGRTIIKGENLDEFWQTEKGKDILKKIKEKEKLNKIEEIVRTRIERDFINDLEAKNPKIKAKEINEILDRKNVASLAETQKMANKLERRRIKIEEELKNKFGEKFTFPQESFYAMIDAGFDMSGIKVTKDLIIFTKNDKSIKLEKFVNYLIKRGREFNKDINESVEESKESRVQEAIEKFRNKRNEAGRELVKNALMEDWIKKALVKLSKHLKKSATEIDLLGGDEYYGNFIDKIAGSNAKAEDKEAIREYLKSKVNPKKSIESEVPSLDILSESELTGSNSEIDSEIDLGGEINRADMGTDINAGDTNIDKNTESWKVPESIDVDASLKESIFKSLQGDIDFLNNRLKELNDEKAKLTGDKLKENEQKLLVVENEILNLQALSIEVMSFNKLSGETAILALNYLHKNSPAKLRLAEIIKGEDFVSEFDKKNPNAKQDIAKKMQDDFESLVDDDFAEFKRDLNGEEQQDKLLSEFSLKIKDKKKDEELTKKEFKDVLISIFGKESGIEDVKERDLCFRALLTAGYHPETIKQKGLFFKGGIFSNKTKEFLAQKKALPRLLKISSFGILPILAKAQDIIEIKKKDGSVEQIQGEKFNEFLEKVKTDYDNKIKELERKKQQEFIESEFAKLAGIINDDMKEIIFAGLRNKSKTKKQTAEAVV